MTIATQMISENFYLAFSLIWDYAPP